MSVRCARSVATVQCFRRCALLRGVSRIDGDVHCEMPGGGSTTNRADVFAPTHHARGQPQARSAVLREALHVPSIERLRCVSPSEAPGPGLGLASFKIHALSGINSSARLI